MRFALLALVLALPAHAADSGTTGTTLIDDKSLETATALRERALANQEAWMALESLTTEVGHRMGGSPGDVRAVAWAQQRFKSLGFDRVYTEPVTFPVWRRGAESVEILKPYPHKLRAVALGSTVGTGRRPIEGEIVAFSTLDALKAASPDQVRGRIVFIGNRMERKKDGSGYSPAVKARSEGPFVAASKGARALLIRSIGTDDNRVAHTGSSVSRREMMQDPEAVKRAHKTRSGIPVLETPIPAAALSNPDADLLSRVLERSRPVTVRALLDVGFEGEHTSANVIGEITGSERPDEIVLIGGHLDSWDQGTGAMDDGAGIAITMAAGHLIGRLDTPPRRTIRVVAFANEENGLFGATAYRDAHAHDVARHVLAAESDFGADRIWRLDTAVKPGALAAIDQMMQVLAPLGIARGDATATGGADVGPMREAGMAVVTLLQDGTRYFDLHHTENDTLDKVDPEALRQNVAAYAVFAYLAAQAQGDFGSAPVAPVATPTASRQEPGR
jgi:hypothetical protein